IDYHGRKPNLYSAKENGLPVSYFAPMLDWLKKVNEPGYDRTAIEETTIAQKISAMYQAFFMQFGSDRSDRNETLQAWLNAPFDLWCVANHLAVAAFSLKAQGYSKMAVRYRMDICNTMTACILKSLRQFSYEDLPEKCPLNSMLLMAAAVALELAGESIDRLPEANGIKILMKDVAIVQKGLLLIDTRVMDPDDTFLLNKVVTQLIKNDIGSVGILQNADAPVHESVVDGFSLDVLPCVTLHPGMDYFFEQMG
ncbi:MAG: hypothetical protein KKE61_14955, partial [Proteobacteria bacterium]|nr:hypothetical protein [Pseudomonadota bacterium]